MKSNDPQAIPFLGSILSPRLAETMPTKHALVMASLSCFQNIRICSEPGIIRFKILLPARKLEQIIAATILVLVGELTVHRGVDCGGTGANTMTAYLGGPLSQERDLTRVPLQLAQFAPHSIALLAQSRASKT
eukprot:1280691-Amphidinium_carterae.1